MSNEVILGVDPGFSTTGFSVVKKKGNVVELLEYGYISLKSRDSLPRRIREFHVFFSQKIIECQITHIALETPFLGKNAQNFLKLGYLRGILYLLCDVHNLTYSEFSPAQIKMKITGFGGADKEQVARCLVRFFPALQSLGKLDVTDAIAIAVCSAWAFPVQSSLLSSF